MSDIEIVSQFEWRNPDAQRIPTGWGYGSDMEVVPVEQHISGVPAPDWAGHSKGAPKTAMTRGKVNKANGD